MNSSMNQQAAYGSYEYGATIMVSEAWSQKTLQLFRAVALVRSNLYVIRLGRHALPLVRALSCYAETNSLL